MGWRAAPSDVDCAPTREAYYSEPLIRRQRCSHGVSVTLVVEGDTSLLSERERFWLDELVARLQHR